MKCRFKGVGHVLLFVRDLDESREFYRQILGLEILEEDPDHGGVFMAVPGGSHVLDLFQSTEPLDDLCEPQKGLENQHRGVGLGHVAFPVESQDELRDAHSFLVENDVFIVALLDHESQQSVYFLDPNHHLLEFYWERPNSRDMFLRGRNDENPDFTFDES